MSKSQSTSPPPDGLMPTESVSWRIVLRNFGRLISPLDIIAQVGNVIYHRSLRYTLFTAAIGMLGLLATQLNLPGLTVKEAVLLPLCIGLLSLLGGGTLRLLPCLISGRLATVAQACDLDLMVDHRKSLVREHLNFLWERVFRHEMRLRLLCGQPLFKDFPYRRDEDVDEVLVRAQPAFVARSVEALDALLPQITQLHEYGLDLRFLEDWRDGACLDPGDTKLAEQFEGNATLVAARQEAGLCGLAMLRFKPRQSAQKMWFSIVTRSVAYQIGWATEQLNGRYHTDLFNAQVLLWPGEEDAKWLRQFEAAREEVLHLRRHAIRKVFGPTPRFAGEVIDHMFYGCFGLATELRMRYDPEYCLGELGYDVLLDLLAEGRHPGDFRRARRLVQQAEKDRQLFQWLLASHRPELRPSDQAEALRSVRIALHVNRGDLRGLLEAARAEDRLLPAEATVAIDQAVKERQLHSRRLLAVRMHHELTRLARHGYRSLIFQLGYTI